MSNERGCDEASRLIKMSVNNPWMIVFGLDSFVVFPNLKGSRYRKLDNGEIFKD